MAGERLHQRGSRKTLKENDNYANKLNLKTRCVTIDYAGDFHLDVVPRVTIDGRHYICNRIDNKFEETDGTGYRDWFNEQNRITGGNLKRVVRLLKYLRDHKNNYTAKSILLTTLAGYTIKPTDEGTEAVGTVAETLVTVLTRMDRLPSATPLYAGDQESGAADGNLQSTLGPDQVREFQDQSQFPCANRQGGLGRSPRSEDAVKIWQELFEENFGKGSGGSSSGGGNGGGGRNNPPSGPRNNPSGIAAPVVGIPRVVTPRKPHAR